MTFLEILFSAGIFGVIGFVLWWFGVFLKAGPDATKKEINDDPNLK